MEPKGISRRQFGGIAFGLGAEALGMRAKERARQELSPEEMVSTAYGDLVEAFNTALANGDQSGAGSIMVQISNVELHRRIALDTMPTISFEDTLDVMFNQGIEKIEFADNKKVVGITGMSRFVAGNEFFRVSGELNPVQRNGDFQYFIEHLEVDTSDRWFVTERTPIEFVANGSSRTTAVIDTPQLTDKNVGLDIVFQGNPSLFVIKGIELVPKPE